MVFPQRRRSLFIYVFVVFVWGCVGQNQRFRLNHSIEYCTLILALVSVLKRYSVFDQVIFFFFARRKSCTFSAHKRETGVWFS